MLLRPWLFGLSIFAYRPIHALAFVTADDTVRVLCAVNSRTQKAHPYFNFFVEGAEIFEMLIKTST